MKFIQTAVGEINVDRIIRAVARDRTDGKGYNTTIFYEEGGEERTTMAYLQDGLAEITQPVVPASPGFIVVQLEMSEPFQVWGAPVIAWRVDTDETTPVTAGESLASDSNPWAILCPDGQVIEPGYTTHGSVDAFRLAVVDRLKARSVPA